MGWASHACRYLLTRPSGHQDFGHVNATVRIPALIASVGIVEVMDKLRVTIREGEDAPALIVS